jgi:decaprenylphospho-beta-D-ribofuranose 2-oxidase
VTKSLRGWGRFPVVTGTERLSENLVAATRGSALTRGLGRAYGDSALPPRPDVPIAGSRLADRILAFDPESGVIRAEAGLSLLALNAFGFARGFSPPVTPGTQFVTLGGMVAADVHGKNHHVAGCIGAHVRALQVQVADGRVLEISDAVEPELFRATRGGMGLTAHILEVELQLERVPSAWLVCERETAHDLVELVEKLRAAGRAWPFTVAWADSSRTSGAIGRGFLTKARWATADEAPREKPVFRERISVPFTMPDWLIGRWSVTPFNLAWYALHARASRGVVHPQGFFYPLDWLRQWNLLYGPSGFTQYQCVLPFETDPLAYERLFEKFVRRCGASPVTVLKDCGPEGKGFLSFPRPGITIALDIPARGARTQALVDSLNEITIAAGGRIYLAKDALTRPEHFAAMEPRLAAFQEIRRKWDPDGALRSAQSVRIFGDRP